MMYHGMVGEMTRLLNCKNLDFLNFNIKLLIKVYCHFIKKLAYKRVIQ